MFITPKKKKKKDLFINQKKEYIVHSSFMMYDSYNYF